MAFPLNVVDALHESDPPERNKKKKATLDFDLFQILNRAIILH